MALSTFDGKKISSRIVLFKGLLRNGFSFYTNYESEKGQALNQFANASLLFYWRELDQQIRINGKVEKQTSEESDKYFSSRDRASQIGAWASLQSEKIDSYEQLKTRYSEFEKKFQNSEVPRPPHWGGYLLIPETFEFWFARASRLHERYCYNKAGTDWSRTMKFP